MVMVHEKDLEYERRLLSWKKKAMEHETVKVFVLP